MELGLEYTDKMAIPPGQTAFPLSGYCVADCTRAALPRTGIIIFGSQLHTHLRGVRVLTRHFRGEQELREVNRDDFYSNHFQEMRTLHYKPRVLPVSEPWSCTLSLSYCMGMAALLHLYRVMHWWPPAIIIRWPIRMPPSVVSPLATRCASTIFIIIPLPSWRFARVLSLRRRWRIISSTWNGECENPISPFIPPPLQGPLDPVHDFRGSTVRHQSKNFAIPSVVCCGNSGCGASFPPACAIFITEMSSTSWVSQKRRRQGAHANCQNANGPGQKQLKLCHNLRPQNDNNNNSEKRVKEKRKDENLH